MPRLTAAAQYSLHQPVARALKAHIDDLRLLPRRPVERSEDGVGVGLAFFKGPRMKNPRAWRKAAECVLTGDQADNGRAVLGILHRHIGQRVEIFGN